MKLWNITLNGRRDNSVFIKKKFKKKFDEVKSELIRIF